MSLGSTNTYDRNLAALRSRQAPTAERIDAYPLPPGSQRRTARDGTESATFLDEQGRRVWLGRSSMPRVSTETQLEGSMLGPGGVSTPGILTGLEPLFLLDQLAPQFAVFVIERRLPLVKLAMHLHDYTAAFRSGRLVVIPENQLDKAFENFFTAYPGYEMPPHLFTAIQRTPNEIAALQGKLETVAGRISAIQRNVACAIGKRLPPVNARRLQDTPRLAVLTVDTHSDTWSLARQLADTAARLGWATACGVPDSPSKCHSVARLQVVADIGANFVLFLGGGSAMLRPWLPESLPIASWFLPTSPVHEGLSPARGPRDSLWAASQSIREQLASTQGPLEQIKDLPMGTLIEFTPESHGPAATTHDGEPLRCLLWADLPPTDPQTCGFGLPSHIAWWNSLVRLALHDASTQRPLDVDDLFERAQQENGTVFDDAGLISRLHDAAARFILPVAETTALVEAVTHAGGRIALYGRHPSELDTSGCEFRGAIPPQEKLRHALRGADILMLPVPDVRAMQWSLDALANGVAVFCRSSVTFHARCSDRLAAPLASIHWFENAAELTTGLNDILADRRAFRSECLRAKREVGKNHNLALRLRHLHHHAVAALQAIPEQTLQA